MQFYFDAGKERELSELAKGFYSVVNPDYAKIFTPFEMLRKIKGEEVIDCKINLIQIKH
jgi:hypothetical protein